MKRSRRLEMLLLVSILAMAPCIAVGASLQWDAVITNTDGTPCADLAGYNAYDVTSTRMKLNTAAIPTGACVSGTCTWTIPVVPIEGKKYVVTAFDTSGNESGDSNIATYATVPSKPGSLIIRIL